MNLNDIFRVVFVSRCGGQNGLNVRHWMVTGKTGGNVTEAEVLRDLATWVSPDYKSLMATTARFRGATGNTIFPVATGVVKDITADGPGTVVGDTFAVQAAGLISLRSLTAGRHGRGRAYIPFASEASNDANGFPTAAYQTQLTALAGKFSTSRTVTGATLGTVTLKPMIWNRAATLATEITSTIIRGAWATQRRRTFLRGGDVDPLL
jgi:hypothetical protein